jgi:hypothetical protein
MQMRRYSRFIRRRFAVDPSRPGLATAWRRFALLGLSFAAAAVIDATSAAGAQALTFTSPERWPAGPGARAVALADVDADGDLDAIVANGAVGTVTVISNDGTGRFLSRTAYAAGDAPVALAVADFNLDGDPDIVAADSAGNRAAVLLGETGAGFAAPAFYSTGFGPCAVAISSGFYGVAPGFVTANAGASSVSAFESDGSGVPVFRTDRAVAAVPRDVVAVDYNADGLGDIVVATADGIALLTAQYEFYDRYFYFLNDALATPGAPSRLVLTDLGASGWNDLAASSAGAGGTVSAWPGDGQTPFGPRADVGAGIEPGALASGDVDGDGDFDIVAVSAGTGAIAVLLGGGGALSLDQVISTGEGIAAVAAGDLDGNGLADIVGALPESGRIVVLRAGDVLGVPGAPIERGLSLDAGPNPARRAVTLNLAVPGGRSARLLVTDVSGRTVFRRDLAAGERSLAWEPVREGRPAGVYFASLESGGSKIVRRIVVVE